MNAYRNPLSPPPPWADCSIAGLAPTASGPGTYSLFTLKSGSGGRLEFRQVVLVNFWPRGADCAVEMPLLDQLQKFHSFAVPGVNVRIEAGARLADNPRLPVVFDSQSTVQQILWWWPCRPRSSRLQRAR